MVSPSYDSCTYCESLWIKASMYRCLINQTLIPTFPGCRGRTPAGVSVLRTYLGSLPPLPALVLSQLPSGELYHYPSHGPIVARSVLHWLEGIRDGTEPPTGTDGGGGRSLAPGSRVQETVSKAKH